MVESKIKHINDDSRQLDICKDMIAKEQLKTTEENHVVQERTKEHHLQNKEEVML